MDAEGWLTSELATFACAACGQPYGEAHIRVIAQREELFFVDLSCPHCGSQAVAIVSIQLEAETGVPEDGDQETDAAGNEPQGPAISVDDVLDMHAFLERFGGDARDLVTHLEGLRR